MTQTEFDTLPGLLTRAQFIAATGLTRHKVRELRRLKMVGTYRPPVQPDCQIAYDKYYKRDAARIGGFELK